MERKAFVFKNIGVVYPVFLPGGPGCSLAAAELNPFKIKD
jgi:hypothetical protein